MYILNKIIKIHTFNSVEYLKKVIVYIIYETVWAQIVMQIGNLNKIRIRYKQFIKILLNFRGNFSVYLQRKNVTVCRLK